MKHRLAIDPGASGGMAWRDRDGIVRAVAMPGGMTAQADQIRSIIADGIGAIVIERVGTYMPGNSGPAAAKFARHCGHLEAIAYMLGTPTDKPVAPGVWMRAMGALPKDKKERKHAIREAMQRAHPHLRVTLKTADALGILAWAERGGT